MSVLLRKIRHTNSAAASVLERADFCTDSEIQSLTREDLHELFPGPEKLKLRKTIFGIIQKPKPIDVILKELKGFIPHDSLRDALSRNGVLVDYLHVLKDLRTQVNNVQSFLEAHIGLLEDISQVQPDQEPERGTSASGPCAPVEQNNIPADIHPYGAHVMYQMVVSGKTFDAHLQLMAKVQAQVQDRVQLISCSQDGQIIIVFCQISSHTGTDIDEAMTNVTDDVPTILVLMHHTHKVKHTVSMKPRSDYSNIVLYVSLFYHEAAHGLLRCRENSVAVSQIKDKLLEFSIPINKWGLNGEYNRNDNIAGDVNAGSEFGFRLFSSSSSSSSSTSSSNSESKSVWEGGE
ncbi:uncharacterized protein LOC121634027 isoform X2 [Melanotaenia boesemani]|uniref:uncharacterized protein LOC121634027 isoform X2 n=1 Tax=Melanotaenia boesemani TaxID=1250792 RepID=UPI001C049476|nr:uncharacterized protein LOC121634027 isoform X2 [Melanotaenia boesemani]